MNKILFDDVSVAVGARDGVEVSVTLVAVVASVVTGEAVNARVGVRGGVTVEAGAGAGVAQAVRIKMTRESLGKRIKRIIKRETRSLASLEMS